MSGLWGNNGSGAAPTKGKTAKVVTCFVCEAELKRFNPSPNPVHGDCASLAVTARRQLERAGALPRHGFNLDGVYTHPLVIERARVMRATMAASAAHEAARICG